MIARISFAQQVGVNPYPYANNTWQQIGPTQTATTTGGPLLVNWSMWIGGGGFGAPNVVCRPSIDGDAAARFELPADLEDQWIASTQHLQVRRTTVYVVPQGTYAFGIQCKASSWFGTVGYNGVGAGVTQMSVVQLQ